MQNRPTTLMERLSERLSAVESSLEKLEPNELLKRVSKLEDSLYTNKEVFNFEETCAYLGISESLLYKMTSSKEDVYKRQTRKRKAR